MCRQIALKALSERLKVSDPTRHSQLPKSFPQQQNHHHQQQQHKHHNHNFRIGHNHSHGSGHSHSLGSGHGHSHGAGSPQVPQSDYLKSFTSSGIQPLPITTDRTEPRMISTMNTIAIPMPAPPPRDKHNMDDTASENTVDNEPSA